MADRGRVRAPDHADHIEVLFCRKVSGFYFSSCNSVFLLIKQFVEEVEQKALLCDPRRSQMTLRLYAVLDATTPARARAVVEFPAGAALVAGRFDSRVAEAIDEVLHGKEMTWPKVREQLASHGDPVIADHPEHWQPTLKAMIVDGTLHQTSRTWRLWREADRGTRVPA